MIRFVMAFLVLGGCGAKPPEAARPAKAQTALVPVPVGTPTLTARAVPREKPGSYQIALEWKAPGLFADEIWVFRATEEGSEKVVARLGRGVVSFADEDVVEDQRLVYRVGWQAEGFWEIGRAAVTVPRDWVVGAGTHAWPGRPFGRVYLEKGSVIQVGEAGLDADWLELHSDGGRIETFGAGATAGIGQVGRPGGAIRLRVGMASGEVDLVSRGESGGEGIAGSSGAPGSAGAPAVPGEYDFEFLRAAAVLEGRAYRKPGDDFTVVRKAPVPAGAGRPGEPGEPGGAGQEGGSSGGVFLEVKAARGFWPRVTSEGGLGGKGGAGGVGGAGGAGGGGAIQSKGKAALPAGPIGERGSDGATGAVGAVGKSGPITVILDGKQLR